MCQFSSASANLLCVVFCQLDRPSALRAFHITAEPSTSTRSFAFSVATFNMDTSGLRAVL